MAGFILGAKKQKILLSKLRYRKGYRDVRINKHRTSDHEMYLGNW